MQTSSLLPSFKLGRLIGSGSTANVYECEGEEHLGERFACKVSPLKHRSSFLAERRVYKKLRNMPGIPQLISSGTASDHQFLVIERMSYTLHTLHEEMEITLEHAASTGIDLLRILQSLHKKGFVHGDIKPSNIGIKVKKGRGFPALLDFGHTKRWKAQAVEPPRAHFQGTLNFASVNVLANHAPSPRDDVISLMYSLIYVLNDGLPWIMETQYPATLSRRDQRRSIACMKNKEIKHMRGSMAAELLDILEEASSMKYGDFPDYARFIDALHRMSTRTW